jgi:YidC/Oxa1 family membrane protein insertase
MERRLLLALALSLLVVLGWSGMVAKLHPIAKQDVTTEKSIPPPVLNMPLPVTNNAKGEIGVQDTAFENVAFGNQEIVFALPSAAIKEVVFKDYLKHQFILRQGFLLKDSSFKFKVEKLGLEPTFTYRDQDKEIIKRFNLDNSNNTISLEIIIKNLSHATIDINYPLVLGTIELSSDQLESRFQEVVLSQGKKILRLNLRRNFSSTENLKFMAITDRYFCLVVQPELTDFRGFINKINNKTAEAGLEYQGKIMPGEEQRLNFSIYIGPEKLSILESINPEWGAIINYGTFDYISKLLLKLLSFFQSKVNNWGVAIILLSLAIYLILFPLSLKQMHSMKRMQELQPKIEKIRQIYKDNPQKLNKEIMELYKKEKANPFSGCLPMLLQIPIFFALYQSLMRSVDLKGADFLWIKDLSEPDRLIMLGQSLPIIGKEINILPVLMAIMMFFQQKFSSMPTAGSSQEQQRLMMILFPILFGFIFYHMPSGLVLYWFINTLLMSIYQFKIKFSKTSL